MALECILTIGINIIKINRYNPNCVIEYCVYGKLFKNSRQIVSNKINKCNNIYMRAPFRTRMVIIDNNYLCYCCIKMLIMQYRKKFAKKL